MGDLSLSLLFGSLVGEPPRGRGSADFLFFLLLDVIGGIAGNTPDGGGIPGMPPAPKSPGFLATILWKDSGLFDIKSKRGPIGGPPACAVMSLRRAAKMPPGPRTEFFAEFERSWLLPFFFPTDLSRSE